MASATQTHQIDLEHLQTEHSHAEQYNAGEALYDEDGHNIKDCHHCGHCSGTHLSWYVTKPTCQLSFELTQGAYSQTPSHTVYRHEPQFKPPKA
ncbi:hypothetical protein [Pseudoalteromonas sp. JW3]|nr:hypothetical protein [Pseudoalteromonas sp. JW3]